MKIVGHKLISECTAYDFKGALERKKIGDWLKSVSAFADTEGGALYYGVYNDGTIVGLEDIQGDSDFISQTIKDRLDPVPQFTLTPDRTEDGKDVLEVYVHEGKQTPYYLSLDGRKIAYVRMGSASVPATSHQLYNLALKGSNRSWDSLVSGEKRSDYTFNTLRSEFELRSGAKWEENLLLSFGLITEEGLLTNAGLLFADQCPIRHSHITCTKWNGLTKGFAVNDSEYSGNLLYLLGIAKSFIKANTAVRWYPLPEYRLNFPEYADRAVEEMCVNHLIHRDYTELGSEVAINIFDDRILTTSPGGIKTTDNLEPVDPETVASKRRNPIIAEVFSQLRYMDKRGSGLRRMREWTAILPSYEDARMPFYQSSREFFFTTLLNVNYGRSEEYFEAICDSKLEPGQWNGERQNITPYASEEERLAAQKNHLARQKLTQRNYPESEIITQRNYPESEKTTQKTVGKTAQAIIDALIEDPRATRADLARRTEKTEDTVKFHLRNLQKRGIIMRVGPDFGGYWKVIIKK